MNSTIKGISNQDVIPDLINVEGGYRIPYWPAINYLIRVSKEHRSNSNVVGQLLNIYNEVSGYQNDEGFCIENHHVHRGFVEILSNIDIQFLTVGILQKMMLWKYLRISDDFTVMKIKEKLFPKLLNCEESRYYPLLDELIAIMIAMLKSLSVKNRENYYFDKIFSDENVRIIAQKCTAKTIKTIEGILRVGYGKESQRTSFQYQNQTYLLELSVSETVFTLTTYKSEEPYQYLFDDKGISLEEEQRYQIGKIFDLNEFKNVVVELFAHDYDINQFDSDIGDKAKYLLYGLLSSGTYDSMYEKKRYLTNDLERYRFLLGKLLCMIPVESVKEVLSGYITEDLYIFQKIALFVIGKNMEAYGELFWEMIASDKGQTVFGDSSFGSELKVALESVKSMTDEEMAVIERLLENGPSTRLLSDELEKRKDVWRVKRA